MKFNKWTVALASAGVVSLATAVQADESHPVNTALSSTTLSGYVDTSAIWNLGTGHTVANRFVNTDSSRQDGFNVNTVNLKLEKPIDEGTWSAGYKFETMFGPDAAAMPGLIANGIALKNAYVALRAPVGNGIDFKIGQFDPIVGYEVTESFKNPNFSRSLGFNNLEPFGHTGILASYQINDILGLSAGIANGDSGFGLNGGGLTAQSGQTSRSLGQNGRGLNNRDSTSIDGRNTAFGESSKVFMGSVVIKAPESAGWLAGSTLYVGAVNGHVENQTFEDPIWENQTDGNGALLPIVTRADKSTYQPGQYKQQTDDKGIPIQGKYVTNTRSEGGDPTLLYVGFTLNTPIKELTVGASADLLFNGDQTGNTATTFTPQPNQADFTVTDPNLRTQLGSYKRNSSANAYAFYTGYQITEKFKISNRFEYATSGYRAFLPGNGNANDPTRDKMIGETLTLDYQLWSNVLTRGEFRWDRAVDGTRPFDDRKNDLSLLASIVYMF